jgi:HD-GYP domain-containing protein (c-di-GMP phosphodiesterase class II)
LWKGAIQAMKNETMDWDSTDDLTALTRQVRNYRHLLELQRRLGSERDIEKLPELLMCELSTLFDAERSTLYLFDAQSMAFRALFAEGVDRESIVVDLAMGLVGASILSRKLINVANAYDHPFFNPRIDAVSGYRTESLLVAPLVNAEGTVVGAIELLNKHTGRFSDVDEQELVTGFQQWQAGLPAWPCEKTRAAAFVATLKQRFRCDRGTIFVLDPESAQLTALYADDLGEGAEVDIRLNLRLGIAGYAAVTGQPLNIPDASLDPRFDSQFDARTGYQTRSVVCHPLINPSGEVLGVLQVINKRHARDFDADDEALLASVASVAAIALENAMLFADQDKQFHSLLAVLAASIDAKDTLTAGHSERVAEFAVGIGTELGFGERELNVLEVAAILHDYGKIGVDDQVLKKRGKLSESEYGHIKQHAKLTFSILDKIHFSRKYRYVPLIASSHHECIDGTGYPRGMNGRDIPFMAKILTVADVFEALTADRHYRNGMSAEAAFAILAEGIGTKFDGNVVLALQKYYDARRAVQGTA